MSFLSETLEKLYFLAGSKSTLSVKEVVEELSDSIGQVEKEQQVEDEVEESTEQETEEVSEAMETQEEGEAEEEETEEEKVEEDEETQEEEQKDEKVRCERSISFKYEDMILSITQYKRDGDKRLVINGFDFKKNDFKNILNELDKKDVKEEFMDDYGLVILLGLLTFVVVSLWTSLFLQGLVKL